MLNRVASDVGPLHLLLRFAVEVRLRLLCRDVFLSVGINELGGADCSSVDVVLSGCSTASTARLGLKQKLLGFRELTLKYDGLAVDVRTFWTIALRAALRTEANRETCSLVLALLSQVRLQDS